MKPSKSVSLLSLACVAVLGMIASLAAASPNLDLARQLNQAFVEVVEKVSPAVVVLTVRQKIPATPPDEIGDLPEEFFPREFWRRYHQEHPEESVGQGSGIIIREDGYILTNGHVVEEAESIEVRLKDGRKFKAKVRGVDTQSDVAVIKIDARGLPVAKLADSAKTRVGEFAIAIGAPFELDYSVTFGHVSAKGRANIVPTFAGSALMDQDFIQTDANINPGNSGGPLANIEGEVIGLNTLIRGFRTGIGFAIPSNLAREVSDQLIAEGKFTRAWLGVSILAVDDGVLVRAILTNGPAATSDLRARDVITAVDGKRVSTPQELRNEVRGKKVGQAVTLDVSRAGKSIQTKVKPAEWVEDSPTLASKANEKPPNENATVNLGVKVQALTRELAEKFSVGLVQGVIVTTVEKAGLAERKGIKPGDVITAVNHRTISSVAEFREAFKKADFKKGVLVNLISGDKTRFEILKQESE